MKKFLIAFATLFATLAPAHAQFQQVAPPPLRYLIGMGLSGGGDKLVEVQYEDGASKDLKAGGLLYFTFGADYRINPEFSVQATINYHVDQADADNGELRFQRFPIELIGYYQPHPQWRVGGGIRYAMNPKLSGSGVADIPDIKFDDATGAVVEVEYFSSPNVGWKARYVNEKYKLPGYGEAKGNHFGISGNLYF